MRVGTVATYHNTTARALVAVTPLRQANLWWMDVGQVGDGARWSTCVTFGGRCCARARWRRGLRGSRRTRHDVGSARRASGLWRRGEHVGEHGSVPRRVTNLHRDLTDL